MHTNDGDREQQIIEAMCQYSRHVEAGGNPRIALWVVSTIENAGLWYEVIDAIAFAQAMGPITPVTADDLTEHERAMSARMAERMRQRWQDRVAAMQRGER